MNALRQLMSQADRFLLATSPHTRVWIEQLPPGWAVTCVLEKPRTKMVLTKQCGWVSADEYVEPHCWRTLGEARVFWQYIASRHVRKRLGMEIL